MTAVKTLNAFMSTSRLVILVGSARFQLATYNNDVQSAVMLMMMMTVQRQRVYILYL